MTMTTDTKSKWTAIGSLLTSLSIIPYEQGPISLIIPPAMKPYVTLIMTILTLLVRFFIPTTPAK